MHLTKREAPRNRPYNGKPCTGLLKKVTPILSEVCLYNSHELHRTGSTMPDGNGQAVDVLMGCQGAQSPSNAFGWRDLDHPALVAPHKGWLLQPPTPCSQKPLQHTAALRHTALPQLKTSRVFTWLLTRC